MASKLYKEGNKDHYKKGLRPITEQPNVLHFQTGKDECTKHVDDIQPGKKTTQIIQHTHYLLILNCNRGIPGIKA